MAEEVGRVHGGQATVAATERRADRFDNDDIGVSERGHESSMVLASAGERRRARALEDRTAPSAAVFLGQSGPLRRRGRRSAMREAIVATGLALTMTLAGCSSDDGAKTAPTTSSSTSSTSSTTVSSTTTTTTTAPCNFTGTTTPQQNALASEVQYLTDVTAVSNGCVDVLTFTFRGSTTVEPSYQISYEPGPFTNTAGQAVRPAGTAFLKIRFEPAWIADLSQEGAPKTYTGPTAITPAGTHVVRGLALYDANEAVVAWVAGIDGQRPFRVEPSAGKVTITIGP
jgi:hypothetical protein